MTAMGAEAKALRLTGSPGTLILAAIGGPRQIAGKLCRFQVVHLNPIYDMQLLAMFPDGLDEMQRQAQAMLGGTHPRAGTIGAIVEDPGYHARLLDYVRRYRRNPATSPIVRAEQTLRGDAHYDAAERTFATLPGFIAYCNQLPKGFGTLLRRHRRTRRFPLELASESVSKQP